MKSVAFKPIGDRILIKRIEVSEKTASGIYVSVGSEKPTEGEVMAVGSGRIMNDGKVVEVRIKVGDRVMFGKYSGSEIQVDGEDYIVMREDDVLGVLVK